MLMASGPTGNRTPLCWVRASGNQPVYDRPVWALQNVCNYDRPKPTSRLDVKQSPVLSTSRCANRLSTAGAFRAVTSWVNPGIPPEVLRRITAPVLAVAGAKEPAYFHRSLRALHAAVPQTETRLVPGVHHIWTVEAPELFDDVLSAWIDGAVHPELAPA